MKVLLVDDDVELAEMLKDYLQQEGFEITAVHDGESGVSEALSGRHAMVILDVMMPRMNGIGLGLAIARLAVESHGGRISARNHANGGLCIDMVLPIDGRSRQSKKGLSGCERNAR